MARECVACPIAGEKPTTPADLSERCCRWVRSSGCLLCLRCPSLSAENTEDHLKAHHSVVRHQQQRLALTLCDQRPFLALRLVADACGMNPTEELRFVRDELESLAFLRLTGPLDLGLLAMYQAPSVSGSMNYFKRCWCWPSWQVCRALPKARHPTTVGGLN